MKEITVNINRTLRQQVTVTANCELEALAMVCGMLTRTNALDYLPDISMAITLSTDNAEMELPEEFFDPAVALGSSQQVTEAETNPEALLGMICRVRDELEAAVEHLDAAAYELMPDGEE